jgi:hypothetical protein
VHPVLVFVELLAASTGIGGFGAIGVAGRVARMQLNPSARVAFFRALGRSYLGVGGVALVLALLAGVALLVPGEWGACKTAAVAVGLALAAVTIFAVRQARSLTRLRSAALAGDRAAATAAERRAGSALRLRATIGVLTLAELVAATALVH